MTGPLYRLGGFCARHAVVVFGIWILIAIGISLGATATRPTVTDIAVALPTARSAPLTSPIHGNLPATSPAESRCPAPAALRVPPGTADDVDDGRTRVSSLGSRAPPVAGY